jgi:tetratricopeptide (TPR) repeat protein
MVSLLSSKDSKMRCSFISVLAVCLLSAELAGAEPDPERAKARWKEGAAALTKGDLESARAAFREAYELVPDAELAQSLGEVEFRTGHFADAARHLTKALESKQLSAEERRTSSASLKKALAKVSPLFLEVNVGGAQLHIDGQLVPVTLPIKEAPWLLDSGAHVLTVRKDGFLDATQNVTAMAGQEIRASLTLSPELNQELFAPTLPPKDAAPKPAPAPPPDPSNPPPPLRWLIAEEAIGAVGMGAGAYFLLKPDATNNDKTMGGALIGVGGFIAAGSLVLYFALRPASPSPPSNQVTLDLPRLRLTF